MFLNELKATTKEGFLKICVYAALSNEVFAEEEKDTLFAYCREMDINEHIPETQESFDELLDKLNVDATKQEKNIIILETLALIKSDGVYDDDENDFMNKLVCGLNLDKNILEKFEKLLDKYIQVGQELYAAIIE